MGAFKRLDIFPHQHQNMAVNGASLVAGYISDFIQHFLFNPNRHTFRRHKITPYGYILC